MTPYLAATSGGQMPGAALAWGLGLALLYTLLAALLFSRVYDYAARSGLLARFSAESVA